MFEPKLFALLEDYVTTPDGMTVAPNGDLVLACPNFADQSKPGCLVRFDEKRKARKWVEVPVHPETKLASPMGIEFGPDGDLYICDNQGWPDRPELAFKGRILRLRIEGDTVVKTEVVATGMEHPNGMRIRDGFVYVTQSMLTRVHHPSGLLTSCVYRFPLDGSNIQVTNTLSDKDIIYTVLTHNPKCQYGLDGIEFDHEGNLIVGNFGDGSLHRIWFDKTRKVKGDELWVKDAANLKSTDGMKMDEKGNLYIADFCANAIARVSPSGVVERIAQSPDTDGFNGELDQPGEPCIWNNMLVVSCFDLVTDDYNINTAHELPATLAYLPLDKISL
ncbi:MAG: phage head-tail adapter protein [Spirochaetia bacterium]|nr:phage head-tail adapter protein [Spirochaetia bacterium]